MTTMTYAEAVRGAIRTRMQENPYVIYMGEDVGQYSVFGVSAGLYGEFGGERVRDTPISESAIIGCAVGGAATGLRPIAEIMFCDFIGVCMDQIANQAAKTLYMTGGMVKVPMVIRCPVGAGTNSGAQHSQSLESWLTHIPGLKVVYPSCGEDAYGMMLSAIDDDNPVVFMEHTKLHYLPFEVNHFDPIPLGKGKIVRAGSDLTIISYGKEVHDAVEAADKLAEQGVSAEVLDLRSLYPLDKELIAQSVSKTHKVIIVSEEVRRGGYAGELSAMIAEELFDELDAPIQRVGGLNTPVPFVPVLEQYFLPQAQDILVAAREIV